jgi:hypothetical protein
MADLGQNVTATHSSTSNDVPNYVGAAADAACADAAPSNMKFTVDSALLAGADAADEYGFVHDVPSERWRWTYRPR